MGGDLGGRGLGRQGEVNKRVEQRALHVGVGGSKKPEWVEKIAVTLTRSEVPQKARVGAARLLRVEERGAEEVVRQLNHCPRRRAAMPRRTVFEIDLQGRGCPVEKVLGAHGDDGMGLRRNEMFVGPEGQRELGVGLVGEELERRLTFRQLLAKCYEQRETECVVMRGLGGCEQAVCFECVGTHGMGKR